MFKLKKKRLKVSSITIGCDGAQPITHQDIEDYYRIDGFIYVQLDKLHIRSYNENIVNVYDVELIEVDV